MKIECPTGTSAFTLVKKLIDFYKNNAPVSIAEVSTYKIRDSTYRLLLLRFNSINIQAPKL